jgi:hypothetical protein
MRPGRCEASRCRQGRVVRCLNLAGWCTCTAGGIDHPLTIERMEYSDSLPGPISIFPHENWKGAFDLGSYDGRTDAERAVQAA